MPWRPWTRQDASGRFGVSAPAETLCRLPVRLPRQIVQDDCPCVQGTITTLRTSRRRAAVSGLLAAVAVTAALTVQRRPP
ncbi:MAG: hypothetical protein ACLP9L_42140 [Thermoguttaceae bacterium]